LRGVEGCVLCAKLLRCCMAANTPQPLHNQARPLSRGDQKNLPNTPDDNTNTGEADTIKV
jgi:hypothetical protein